MSSIYPDAIDGQEQIPLVKDGITGVTAASVNSLRSAILNIEEELGLVPRGAYLTVRERLDELEGLVSDILNDIITTSGTEPCRVASTSNILDLSSGAPDIVDNISLAVNDRVLVKDQSTLSQNGIYSVQSVGTGSNGIWVRADDFNISSDVSAGLSFYIEEGTSNEKSFYTLTTIGNIIVGTTSIQFEEVSGGGTGEDVNAIHDNQSGEIAAITAKSPTASGDYLLIEDSAAGNTKKSITIADIRITESQITDLDTTVYIGPATFATLPADTAAHLLLPPFGYKLTAIYIRHEDASGSPTIPINGELTLQRDNNNSLTNQLVSGVVDLTSITNYGELLTLDTTNDVGDGSLLTGTESNREYTFPSLLKLSVANLDCSDEAELYIWAKFEII